MRLKVAIVALLLVGCARWTSAQQPAANLTAEITTSLKKLAAQLADEKVPEESRGELGRALREQIRAANHRSSSEWARIASREDWERFREERLKLLRESLGTFPECPAKTKLMVTRTIKGDGFRIQNLVYESRPGLVVTANLYVPDPLRSPLPGILISHSHHNPKHEGELQDMGMTWARAGCYVLVPDHLGHGERRQHPFASAADYDGEFPVGRQDYNFRYDTSLQLYLVGESLMGWMVHDLMTGVDVLLAQPGIDAKKIILLGAVAGGGDPAGVTAALDERIACVVPFNFGGPQPENRYPLPDDAETTFNYAGGGSWESTRNLRNSASDGFLPWVIVGSVAPRKLVHAHEFSWDRERDPVWKRYEKIWSLYNSSDGLAFTHGFGTIKNTAAPASHCNNIGADHRKLIHEAFRQWFAIDVKPEDEYKSRRSRDELTCLTDDARKEFSPKPLHTLLGELADKNLATVRERRARLSPTDNLADARTSWTRLLGDTAPRMESKVREGSHSETKIGPVRVVRETVESEPGIGVPILTLSVPTDDGGPSFLPIIVGVASDGIRPALDRQIPNLAAPLKAGATVVLVEVRGTGASNPESNRGQQSEASANSATALMLGRPLLAGQLLDLRTAWHHVRKREGGDKRQSIAVGGSGVEPLPADASFAYPRRIDHRPAECRPTGALLALLMALYEGDFSTVAYRRGLGSYRSILDSPFVQVPHEAIVPGMLREGDIADLIAALEGISIEVEQPLDGRGRSALLPTLDPQRVRD
jgi:dienelactone hydrolase